MNRVAASSGRGATVGNRRWPSAVADRGEPEGRLVTSRLLAFAAAEVAVGLLLLVVGPVWLGIVALLAPVIGLPPLVLEDRRRRR